MNMLGYLLVIGSCVLLYQAHIYSPVLYVCLGLTALLNKLTPRLFILWVIVGVGTAYGMTFSILTPYLIFVIGLYGIGLVLQVL